MDADFDRTYFKDGSRAHQGMQMSSSAPLSTGFAAPRVSSAPALGTSAAAEGNRKMKLKQIMEYSDEVLAEVALSPQHSRSWSGEEPFKKPRDQCGRPPTSDGRRPSLGLGKVRPATPIDDSVKHLNLNRLHLFSSATGLEDEVLQVHKRTVDALSRERAASESRKAFKRDLLEKVRASSNVRDTGADAKKIKQAQMLVSGFARARASQSPLRKRFVVPQTPSCMSPSKLRLSPASEDDMSASMSVASMSVADSDDFEDIAGQVGFSWPALTEQL